MKELLASMDAQELTDWEAFAQLEPFAIDADRRMALLACVIANSQGGKKDGGSFELSDFVPDLDKEAEAQEATDMRAVAEAILGSFDVIDNRTKV